MMGCQSSSRYALSTISPSMALHGLPYPSMAVHALTAGLPIVEQIKEALMANAARVVDLFREFDTDGDGEVTLAEFERAMPLLGLAIDREQVVELFNSFDADGGGAISFREVTHACTIYSYRTITPSLPPRL